ncbi:MAG: hypothetical protein GXP40_02405 [Chloroflexi bacterium]|nr:hypothetical protein [Chloroflexota bacterium]
MNTTRSRNQGLSALLGGRTIQRGAAWGMMIIGALLAFELFNFSTTDFALRDVLGDLRFLGIRWATILAFAFCGIDFAGIARIFTPEQGREEPAEVWYLFGAWLLAAIMNAMLTWWGVSIAITSTSHAGSAVVSSATMTKVIPIFVAVMVWLIRVLIIGTFSLAGDRLFSQLDQGQIRKTSSSAKPSRRTTARPSTAANRAAPVFRAAPKPARGEPAFRQEPTYHNLMSARPTQQTFGDRASSYDASSRRQEH